MSNSHSAKENPFKKIERIIILVLVVWLFAVGGWFINNQQVPAQRKLATNVKDFLEDKGITASELNCVVDVEQDVGTCNVTAIGRKNMVVQCSVKSAFFDFAEVFFAKGNPCGFAAPE